MGGVGGEASVLGLGGLGGVERRRRGGDVDGESGTQQKVHFDEAKRRKEKSVLFWCWNLRDEMKGLKKRTEN